MPHSSSSTADGQEEKQKGENKVVKHLKVFCPKMVAHGTKLVAINIRMHIKERSRNTLS